MKEQLISSKTAILAKEKNFPDTYIRGDGYPERKCLLPTQSLLQKWLREIHNIDVQPYPRLKNIWRFTISKLDSHPKYYVIQMSRDWSKDASTYKTYEESLEKALYEALELITV